MARITKEAKQASRRRLLATAAEHFARHGLAGAQVDAIAQDAGFGKGTLYNYFESKEQLFAEVVAEGGRLAVERFEAVPDEGEVRARLTALAEADAAVLGENEAFMQVVVREAMGFRPDTFPLVVESLAPFVLRVVTILEDAVACGEVRDDRPLVDLAQLFVGVLTLHYIQRWAIGRPELHEIPALAVTTFLDGARGR